MKEARTSQSLERETVTETIGIETKTTPFEELDDEVKLAIDCANEKKAMQVVALDLREITSFTEFFVVTHGMNTRHVQAIADEISKELKKQKGLSPVRIEGYSAAQWVLLDYGDFITHIFNEESRSFYDLERLWRDASVVELDTPEE